MSALEMKFFYDEGLETADGSLAYEILCDPMVPFGLEKLGSPSDEGKSIDVALDVQSRTIFFQDRGRGRLYHRGMAQPAYGRQHRSAAYQIPKELKGKRIGISDFNSVRHWGIQIQLRKASLDKERDADG
jgi:hypothetical protein